MPKSSLKYIRSNEKRIKKCAEHVSAEAAKRIVRPRKVMLSKMESRLYAWIVDQRSRDAALSETLIRQKAATLFNVLKSECLGDDQLLASHGWFQNFKFRFQLKSVYLRGEAASADAEAAAKFKIEFENILKEGQYSPKYIFNVDETALYWKKLPSRTYVTQNGQPSGYKMQKNRLTLLLGGNANGDIKLKPLVLFTAETPRALKYIDKKSLPVIWRSNRKAWVTRSIFSEWFSCYFVPFVSSYTEEQNIDNKALLLLDNAPGHPPNLTLEYPHIKVVFLPSNTTSLIQPMDQGIISTFKTYYLRQVLRHIVDSTSDTGEDVLTCWKKYDIAMAIKNIDVAWTAISRSTMQRVWKNLWPDVVIDKVSESHATADCSQEIVGLCEQARLDNITVDDVKDVTAHQLYEQPAEIELSSLNSSNAETSDVITEKEKIAKILNAAQYFKQVVRTYDDSEDFKNTCCAVIDGLMNKYSKEY